MNLMLKEEWICPPSLVESVRMKARGSALANKDGNKSYLSPFGTSLRQFLVLPQYHILYVAEDG